MTGAPLLGQVDALEGGHVAGHEGVDVLGLEAGVLVTGAHRLPDQLGDVYVAALADVLGDADSDYGYFILSPSHSPPSTKTMFSWAQIAVCPWARAVLTPFTWCSPASPRSCMAASMTRVRPVAQATLAPDAPPEALTGSLPVTRGGAGVEEGAALAGAAEAQGFVGHQLLVGEVLVHLGQVDLGGGILDARLL